jgi:hypothetical protein
MAIPETPVDIRFSGLNQRRYGKLLLPGQLTIAENVIQIEEGVFEKRDGYSPMDRYTSQAEADAEPPGGGDDL